jgi:hypothetical protein
MPSLTYLGQALRGGAARPATPISSPARPVVDLKAVAGPKVVASWQAYVAATKKVDAARESASAAYVATLINRGRPGAERAHQLRLEHKAAKRRAEDAAAEQLRCKQAYVAAVQDFYRVS